MKIVRSTVCIVLCFFLVIMLMIAGGNMKLVNIRLVDGKTQMEGRVEVRHNGVWGTICNDGNWDIWDAYVVCHMLNYSKAAAGNTALVQGNGPILLKIADGNCKGHEKSIDECRHNGWGSTAGCDHSHDAGVVCADLTTDEDAIKVRLVGDQNHTGKVEIQYKGNWGAVCDYHWDLQDAHVICRMLGYKAAKHAIQYIEGETKRTPLMYDVQCSGKETSIAECAHAGWANIACYKKRLAGVVCQTNEDPPPIQVCLSGGKSANSGRIEVRYNGHWGTVCDDGWAMSDAEVVCRMLGYIGVQEKTYTNFPAIKGVIWLDDIRCSGKELTIANCSRLRWGMSKCYHGEDVGVTCLVNTSSTSNTKVIDRCNKPMNQKEEAAGHESTTKCNNCTSNATVDIIATFVPDFKLRRNNISNLFELELKYNGTLMFQVILRKINSDSEILTTLPENIPSVNNPSDVPNLYITAQVNGSRVALGDGNKYGGYRNIPLDTESKYRVYVRVVRRDDKGKLVYSDSKSVILDGSLLENPSSLDVEPTQVTIAEATSPSWSNYVVIYIVVPVITVIVLAIVVILAIVISKKRAKRNDDETLERESASNNNYTNVGRDVIELQNITDETLNKTTKDNNESPNEGQYASLGDLTTHPSENVTSAYESLDQATRETREPSEQNIKDEALSKNTKNNNESTNERQYASLGDLTPHPSENATSAYESLDQATRETREPSEPKVSTGLYQSLNDLNTCTEDQPYEDVKNIKV